MQIRAYPPMHPINYELYSNLSVHFLELNNWIKSENFKLKKCEITESMEDLAAIFITLFLHLVGQKFKPPGTQAPTLH